MDDIKKLNSQVAKLADLINYQDNSVVSREILKGENGNATVFAFDEGEAKIMISRKKHNLKEGDVIILPANEPHSMKAIKRFKMMLVMVKK